MQLFAVSRPRWNDASRRALITLFAVRRSTEVLFTACVALALILPAAAQAPQQATATEWKLSTALGPSYPQGRGGVIWARLIRERSGGRLNVTVFPGATLTQRDAAREFGALLSTAREVEERIRDAQTLVHEVEVEMRRIFQDAPSAYQRVMYRRAHPNEAVEEEVEFSRGRRGGGRKVSDFEKEALFQEWV